MKKKKSLKNEHKNKYAHLKKSDALKLPEIFVAQKQLDYHGRGPMSRYEIEKLLEDFLLDSFSSGLKRVLIVTGKGAIVRPLVKSALTKNPYVKSFKHAGYYNGQTGAFEVVLKEK